MADACAQRKMRKTVRQQARPRSRIGGPLLILVWTTVGVAIPHQRGGAWITNCSKRVLNCILFIGSIITIREGGAADIDRRLLRIFCEVVPITRRISIYRHQYPEKDPRCCPGTQRGYLEVTVRQCRIWIATAHRIDILEQPIIRPTVCCEPKSNCHAQSAIVPV